MLSGTTTFNQLAQENPCSGCPAPCCRMQITPYKTPNTFIDLDHVRYMLLFPATEMVVTAAGDWTLLKWQTCSLFETEICTCKVHNTPAQPRICVHFNPYNCWYKRNFVTEKPTEIYRLNLERFELWIKEIQFDNNGVIVSAPDFERSQEMFQTVPIPSFKILPELVK